MRPILKIRIRMQLNHETCRDPPYQNLAESWGLTWISVSESGWIMRLIVNIVSQSIWAMRPIVNLRSRMQLNHGAYHWKRWDKLLQWQVNLLDSNEQRFPHGDAHVYKRMTNIRECGILHLVPFEFRIRITLMQRGNKVKCILIHIHNKGYLLK
jgi:hypothetical protein